MENKEKKQLKEEPLELVKYIGINDCVRGPHEEIPANMYYAQLRAFEKLYNIKTNKGE